MRTAIVLACVVAAAGGCNKDSQPAPEQPRSATQAGQPAPAAPAALVPPAGSAEAVPAATAAAKSSAIEEDSFALLLRPSGSYKVGQAGQVEVVLDAKAPYKVNDKYPYKFKLEPSAGLKFPNQVVKEGVKLEQKRAVMPVGFTPESSGPKNVRGQFSFSVCTEERCLIEKRDLSLAIDVQ